MALSAERANRSRDSRLRSGDVVSIGIALLDQCRKPKGWLGRLNLLLMNSRHSALTDWALDALSVGDAELILDVGCGGGRTVQKLAARAGRAKIYGIDFSAESVAVSRRTNRAWIETGRVEIRAGSVSHLPFTDGTFDFVTAVETHYYWPDLVADLREVLRVLKPGGALAIVAEAYKGGKYDERLKRLAEVAKFMNYAHLSIREHEELFTRAGYTDVRAVENYDKGWICVMGRRPAGPVRQGTAS